MAPRDYWRTKAHRIVATIGRGAQSTIYRVVDERDGRQYALKRVVRRGPQDDRFVEQAVIEYTVASGVNHPHLRRALAMRRVRRFFSLKEVHLLLEWVPGETLEKECPGDLSVLCGVFVAIGRGLQALHQTGFVHCDVKPNNIILNGGKAATAKLIDFGQSCPIGHRKARIQGTPEYIAPEQVGRLPLDARTDVFNLGATLYWALTKHNIPTMLPYRPQNAGLVMEYNRREFVRPEQIDSRVPVALSKLVQECCQEVPDRRPSDMDQVILRLEMVKHILDGRFRGSGSARGNGGGTVRRSSRAV